MLEQVRRVASRPRERCGSGSSTGSVFALARGSGTLPGSGVAVCTTATPSVVPLDDALAGAQCTQV